MRPDFFLGLDLGETRDFTALAVLERLPPPEAVMAADKPEYALRHLHRFPLGTPYTEIVPAVATLVRAVPLAESPVVVDQTGVGRAVVDMLCQTIGWVVPVTITGGHAGTVAENRSFHVPKKELVISLQVVIQSRRLRIARGLQGGPDRPGPRARVGTRRTGPHRLVCAAVDPLAAGNALSRNRCCREADRREAAQAGAGGRCHRRRRNFAGTLAIAPSDSPAVSASAPASPSRRTDETNSRICSPSSLSYSFFKMRAG
jgi:hypothetical protein